MDKVLNIFSIIFAIWIGFRQIRQRQNATNLQIQKNLEAQANLIRKELQVKAYSQISESAMRYILKVGALRGLIHAIRNQIDVFVQVGYGSPPVTGQELSQSFLDLRSEEVYITLDIHEILSKTLRSMRGEFIENSQITMESFCKYRELMLPLLPSSEDAVKPTRDLQQLRSSPNQENLDNLRQSSDEVLRHLDFEIEVTRYWCRVLQNEFLGDIFGNQIDVQKPVVLAR